MNKKIYCIALCALVSALSVSVQAQQPTKVPRVGYLFNLSPTAASARAEAFQQGLRELGYVEGKNISLEYRHAEGRLDRIATLAAELVRLKVDIIVTSGPSVTRAAKQATAAIPIVMTFDSDPVGDGIIASLARPGGNVTGLSALAPELSGKRLEILREVVAKLARVAVLGSSTFAGQTQMLREVQLAAQAFKLQLQYLDVFDPKDIDIAFRSAAKERANAILTLPSGILSSQRARIVELAVKNRLPAMYHQELFIDVGGLMFYGVSILDLDGRAATYIDKILKGRTPADLPVEQPKKFEFIVNLKAAKQIDLTIPPNVLARADRVIK